MLREFTHSDAEHLYLLNSDPDVIRHTGDPPFNSLQEAENFLRNYKEYQMNGFGRWAVILKKENRFIGWCGLKRNEENMVDLGFRFFKKDWGNGYATEAAKASLEIGFNQMNIDRIIGRAATENIASIKVLEKLNMNFWKNDVCQGIDNSAYYSITSSEFKALSKSTL
jgi:RimJ/RimL family protein N-acetyltransferase